VKNGSFSRRNPAQVCPRAHAEAVSPILLGDNDVKMSGRLLKSSKNPA